ncbi:MAG: replication-associated recombination protein A, partial [candidate division Zixibacteria bacterium]|nr:replication-associated recombination protein A [candidate division Zixibacteria bacterium]
VRDTIQSNPSLPAPLWIRNAVTPLLKQVGYGRGYLYPHDFDDALVDQEYLPTQLAGTQFYHPTQRGLESDIQRRLQIVRQWKSERRAGAGPGGTDPTGLER